MVMSVNTNISSLNAQHNLAKSQSKLSTAIERLSSGMRINSAKDDAAGLSISTRFTTQINGLNQAVRNANDGISMAQTTESALDEVTNNLQRIRELAVQSANGSNSDADRTALNKEVQQRLAEVTRISSQTNFNGKHVLNGSAGSTSFQVGANVGETISVNLSQGTRTQDMGQLATASGALTGAFGVTTTTGGSAAVAGTKAQFTSAAVTAGQDLSASSITVGSTAITLGDYTGDSDLTAMVVDINTALSADSSDISASEVGGKIVFAAATASAGDIAITDDDSVLGTGTKVTGTADVGAVAGTTTTVPGDLVLTGTQFTLKAGDGAAVAITGTFKDAGALADAINSKGIEGLSASVDKDGALQLTSQKDLTVGGTKAGAGAGNLGFATTLNAAGGSLDSVDVSTVDGANNTMSRIDAALQTVSDLRSDLGAVQNRFDSTISNLTTISQNLSSSRSQIQDADFASETANMTTANILQQAGVSVLAQANSSTQSVLKLLQ